MWTFATFLIVFSASWIDVDALIIGLALVGKAAVVSCFCTIFIYSSEIFPTDQNCRGWIVCIFCTSWITFSTTATARGKK